MNNVRKVNAFILITVLFVAAAGVPMSLIRSRTLLVFLSAFVYVLPFVVYYIIFGRKTECLQIKPVRVGILLKCILLYICLYPVMVLLNTISMLYSQNEAVTLLSGMVDNTPFWITLLGTAILPPLCEEFAYRGVIYGTYRKVNPLGAIIMSGVVFGLMHGNLNQFTYAVFLGMVFCLVVEATDSLVTTMILHALVNAGSTSLVYILDHAIKYVNSVYEEAVEAGDTITIELIDSLVGKPGGFSANAILEASQAASDTNTLSYVIGAIIPAAIGGAIAFLLFRNIAKSCGRWEYIVGIFTKKGSELVPEYHRLWSPCLIAAVVLMIAEMILYMLPIG